MTLRQSGTVLLPIAAALCAAAIGCHDAPSDPAPIEILIDSMGVPHIYARSDEEAFYGAGYRMAADRLYQMAMLRRFALGRLSEVLGEESLLRDMQARTFDLPRWGRMDGALMRREDPERVRLLHAWVRGINHRIREVRSGDAPLPFGFRPDEHDFLPELWGPDDPYIVLKGAGFALDKTVEFEIAVSLLHTLYPDAMSAVEIFKPAHPVYGIPPEDRPRVASAGPSTGAAPPAGVTPPGDGPGPVRPTFAARRALPPRLGGSNNWAVHGRFTETGRPLIAGDPHLAFDFFGAPYPMHINSADAGGTYDVAGFAYPGTPGIALGHNHRVIWTATSAFGDVNDIWRVEKRGDRVRVGHVWRPISTRTEAILVRDPERPVGVGRVEEMVYEDVEGYGVIIPREIAGVPLPGTYLMNWTGFTARPARWFMELNRVDTLDAFEGAVDRMREMNYSFVAADAGGIAYRVGVELPLRRDTGGDRAPWKGMDGSDPGSLWTDDRVPRHRMPRSRAGERGWLATANNDPFGFTEDGRVDNDPWYYGAWFAPGYRAKRIEMELERITVRGGVTLGDMKALQLDLHSTLADDLLPLLSDAHSLAGVADDLARFRDREPLDVLVRLLTSHWDRRMARDSAGALAFHAFLHFLTAGVLKDDIPLAYDFAVGLQTIFVLKVAALALAGAYPRGDEILQEGRDTLLLEAACSTADWLESRFGAVLPANYAYSDRKVTEFGDAFGFGMALFSRPTDGGEDTVNVSQNIAFSPWADEWPSSYVPVERSLGTFAADGTPELHVTFPVAAHADPESPESVGANEDYIEGRYRKLLFRRHEIEAAARERFALTPE